MSISKRTFNKFKFRVFLLLDCLPYQGWRALSILFTHCWKENSWIHTFLKGISVVWNANSLFQGLNSVRCLQFLRRYPWDTRALVLQLNIVTWITCFYRVFFFLSFFFRASSFSLPSNMFLLSTWIMSFLLGLTWLELLWSYHLYWQFLVMQFTSSSKLPAISER